MNTIKFKLISLIIIFNLLLIKLSFSQSNNDKEDKALYKANKELIKLEAEESEKIRKYNNTFVAKFKKYKKEVHFIAAHHSSDFESITFKTIDFEFKDFKPDVVIVERENSAMGISPYEIKKKFINNKKDIHGEPDYAVYLAVNERKKTIDFFLAEPTTEFVLKNIINYPIDNIKFTEKDVLFFYTIRTFRDFIKRRSINSLQGLKNEFPDLLNERINKYGFNKSFYKLTLNDFMNWYKDKMGFEFDYKNIPNFTPMGKDNISLIDKYISYIRNINIADNIEKIINKYDKVLIVYGRGHYSILKPVLVDMLGQELEEKQVFDYIPNENDIFKQIKDKVKNGYSAWIKSVDDYSIMYYGDIENFDEIKFCDDYLATGWSHLIYYKNKTKKNNLYSIGILAKQYGNTDNNFYFIIQDIKGKTIYQSKEYKYSEFPKENFEYKEFIVDIKNIPDEFLIILKTSSTRDNGLSIISIPSSKNVYSFEYLNPSEFKEYGRKENAAIFPKFN